MAPFSLNLNGTWLSIPMAQGGLSRLAIARLKSAGVPVAPLLSTWTDAGAESPTGEPTECANQIALWMRRRLL